MSTKQKRGRGSRMDENDDEEEGVMQDTSDSVDGQFRKNKRRVTKHAELGMCWSVTLKVIGGIVIAGYLILHCFAIAELSRFNEYVFAKVAWVYMVWTATIVAFVGACAAGFVSFRNSQIERAARRAGKTTEAAQLVKPWPKPMHSVSQSVFFFLMWAALAGCWQAWFMNSDRFDANAKNQVRDLFWGVIVATLLTVWNVLCYAMRVMIDSCLDATCVSYADDD